MLTKGVKREIKNKFHTELNRKYLEVLASKLNRSSERNKNGAAVFKTTTNHCNPILF